VAADGVRLISMAQLIEDGQPLAFRGPEAEAFIWRGAQEVAALREFLSDVAWGPLDLLLIDLPPGIGRFAELISLLPTPPAVLTVTIPTVESRDAVRRALRAAVEHDAPAIGIVENMVGDQFPGDAADSLAAEFGVPVLARIPFHPADAVWSDLAARI
jgi:ATP-binding protein involved in chromosome partitioning